MSSRSVPGRARGILRQLGAMPVARFMREYWQRRPVVLRAALPGFTPTIDRARLIDWARDPNVESRLITSFGGRWSMKHGPIARMPARERARWTLLVQGVDALDEAAHELLARFRFVPDARLDDLMVSLASDGGGVGPHVDSYDVFLLQAQGRRRWRISRQTGLETRPGLPLRILRDFRPEQEWTLEPGDMLYLPPGVAHEGVALGECMTWSIGFRAPTWQELVEPWLAQLAEDARLDGRFGDRGLRAARRPAALPPAMTAQIHARLQRIRPTTGATEKFLLRHLSEPKAQVVFEAPRASLSCARFRTAAARAGIRLDRRTRVLYTSRALAINGEWIAERAPVLRRLADRRRLDGAALSDVDAGALALLHDWYRAGWLHLDRA